jgi:hypothetical protein
MAEAPKTQHRTFTLPEFSMAELREVHEATIVKMQQLLESDEPGWSARDRQWALAVRDLCLVSQTLASLIERLAPALVKAERPLVGISEAKRTRKVATKSTDDQGNTVFDITETPKDG